jgi:DNA-binding NarL/FixJ family response regulator
LAADRAAARARRLVAGCEGAATPLLAGLGPDAALSQREREVARLAADGMSNREIAEHLVLSERTIENHLQRVFTKLGVSRRETLASALGANQED